MAITVHRPEARALSTAMFQPEKLRIRQFLGTNVARGWGYQSQSESWPSSRDQFLFGLEMLVSDGVVTTIESNPIDWAVTHDGEAAPITIKRSKNQTRFICLVVDEDPQDLNPVAESSVGHVQSPTTAWNFFNNGGGAGGAAGVPIDIIGLPADCTIIGCFSFAPLTGVSSDNYHDISAKSENSVTLSVLTTGRVVVVWYVAQPDAAVLLDARGAARRPMMTFDAMRYGLLTGLAGSGVDNRIKVPDLDPGDYCPNGLLFVGGVSSPTAIQPYSVTMHEDGGIYSTFGASAGDAVFLHWFKGRN